MRIHSQIAECSLSYAKINKKSHYRPAAHEKGLVGARWRTDWAAFVIIYSFFPRFLINFVTSRNVIYSNMRNEERYRLVLEHFRREMPEVNTELEFGSVFQLLVAVVLSAQCTDKRINQVTPELFRQYPTAKAMAEAEADDVLEYIKSVSYPNAKAKHLVAMARVLTEKHNGEVPPDMNSLLDLPGVGRKTANVIQSVAFGKSTMAVDTHVFRVSHRLGLVSAKDDTPLKVEKELMKHIPEDDIPRAHHWLLLHGRYVCTSRKPHCDKCELNKICPKRLENSKL